MGYPAGLDNIEGAGRTGRSLELADILRVHGEAYLRSHRVSPRQAAAMRDIVRCRTAALGGHADHCDQCGHIEISYNSCRNRHCPKCQGLERAAWVEQRLKRVLPAGHFHVVFTVPDKLNPLALKNPKAFYDTLFSAASRTLLELGLEAKHLGAELGISAVLHTWGRNLLFHPHLHCIVTAGGLDPPGREWVGSRPGFLFPVKVLSRLFRGKFLDSLSRAYERGRLDAHGSVEALSDPEAFRGLLSELYRAEWVVYSKPPFAGTGRLVKYLGRYTHRTAVSNGQLVSMRGGKVSFRAKDYARGGRVRIITLDAGEFIRRFLLHVLPKGFVRIRHYGLYSSRNAEKLDLCRRILNHDPQPENRQASCDETKSWEDRLKELTGIDARLCPRCGKGKMITRRIIPPGGIAAFPVRWMDSS